MVEEKCTEMGYGRMHGGYGRLWKAMEECMEAGSRRGRAWRITSRGEEADLECAVG